MDYFVITDICLIHFFPCVVFSGFVAYKKCKQLTSLIKKKTCSSLIDKRVCLEDPHF